MNSQLEIKLFLQFIQFEHIILKISKMEDVQLQSKPHRRSFFNNETLHSKQVPLICKTILNIWFGQESLVITSQKGIVIYSLKTKKPIFSLQENIQMAVCIPNTNYICYVDGQTDKIDRQQSLKIMNIYDLINKKNAGKVKMKKKIQQILVNKKCIGIASTQDIFVLNFPSLKPLYHTEAGNRSNVVFDMSYNGLTICHQTITVGVIMIRNVLTPIEFFKKRQSNLSMLSKIKAAQEQKHEPGVIQIQAYTSQIQIIRVSPNGGRVAVCCDLGSEIFIYNSLTGQKYQSLSMGFDPQTIIKGLSFNAEGSILCSIDNLGEIAVFNTKLDPYEESVYKEKFKHQSYHEKNPISPKIVGTLCKPIFSCQQPFSFYSISHRSQKKIQQTKVSSLSNSIQQLPIIQEQVQQQFLPRQSSILEIHNRPISNSPISKKLTNQSLINLESSVHISCNYQVWVVKKNYISILKYDPFNGGKMYLVTQIQIK